MNNLKQPVSTPASSHGNRKERVALLSRISTQNAGNEALSIEFINFFKALLPNAEVRAMDRYPQYLYAFRISRLGEDEATIITNFDAAVWKLAARFKREAPLAPIATEQLVKLDLTANELPKTVAKVKRIIGLRRRLAHFGLVGRGNMASAIATCRWADKLVWNPAGEIHPTGNSDEVLRLLMLVRLAQLSGVKTYIVNHSLEVEDEKLRHLIKHVYNHAEIIALRDKQSCVEARKLGIPNERIREIPDMVFLSAESDAKRLPPDSERFPEGAIGLAINGLEAQSGSNEWDELMEGLKALGRPIVFLSNAMNHDLPFAHSLAKAHELLIVERQPSYREIRGFYGDLGLLISSRLHSSIIALSEGVPVMTIEPSVFKLTGIFEQLAYPIATLNLHRTGWASQMLTNCKEALQNENLGRYGKTACIQKSREIHVRYAEIFANEYADEASVSNVAFA